MKPPQRLARQLCTGYTYTALLRKSFATQQRSNSCEIANEAEPNPEDANPASEELQMLLSDDDSEDEEDDEEEEKDEDEEEEKNGVEDKEHTISLSPRGGTSHSAKREWSDLVLRISQANEREFPFVPLKRQEIIDEVVAHALYNRLLFQEFVSYMFHRRRYNRQYFALKRMVKDHGGVKGPVFMEEWTLLGDRIRKGYSKDQNRYRLESAFSVDMFAKPFREALVVLFRTVESKHLASMSFSWKKRHEVLVWIFTLLTTRTKTYAPSRSSLHPRRRRGRPRRHRIVCSSNSAPEEVDSDSDGGANEEEDDPYHLEEDPDDDASTDPVLTTTTTMLDAFWTRHIMTLWYFSQTTVSQNEWRVNYYSVLKLMHRRMVDQGCMVSKAVVQAEQELSTLGWKGALWTHGLVDDDDEEDDGGDDEEGSFFGARKKGRKRKNRGTTGASKPVKRPWLSAFRLVEDDPPGVSTMTPPTLSSPPVTTTTCPSKTIVQSISLVVPSRSREETNARKKSTKNRHKKKLRRSHSDLYVKLPSPRKERRTESVMPCLRILDEFMPQALPFFSTVRLPVLSPKPSDPGVRAVPTTPTPTVEMATTTTPRITLPTTACTTPTSLSPCTSDEDQSVDPRTDSNESRTVVFRDAVEKESAPAGVVNGSAVLEERVVYFAADEMNMLNDLLF